MSPGWLRMLCVVGPLCAASGCGDDPANRFVPVTGTVRLDGAPLTTGFVSFRPDVSRGNQSRHVPIGEIDARGRYELVTIEKKGAPAGWYKVLVFADANRLSSDSLSHPLPPLWLIDEKYTDEKTTDLFIEVVEKPAPASYDIHVGK